MPAASHALGSDYRDVVVVVFEHPRPVAPDRPSDDYCAACGFGGALIDLPPTIGTRVMTNDVHAPCLALVRAGTSPQDWKDFLDRQLRLLSSPHWTWSRTAQLIAIPFGFATVAALYFAAARLLPHLPSVWMPIGGGGALAGVVLARLRRSRRRA
ncbi:hypothetical protein [Nocardia sp. NPDC020380]|uniref:hypothetical protein n=1 Tax=Nocardia sp. NPDC020380 TaxID=3364309 RepID=UPI0037B9C95B